MQQIKYLLFPLPHTLCSLLTSEKQVQKKVNYVKSAVSDQVSLKEK